MVLQGLLRPDRSGLAKTDYFAAVMVRQASFVKLRTGTTNGFGNVIRAVVLINKGK